MCVAKLSAIIRPRIIAAPPRGGPHIQGVPSREVRMGEELMINCTSLKSKPAAKLEFFINDRKVRADNYKPGITVNTGYVEDC